MAHTLPIELYRSILRHILSRRTLYTLLLVSRDFYMEAERLLYRTIRMVHHDYKTRLSLFKRLSSCRKVALLVHDLTIVHDFHPHPHPSLPLIPAESYWIPLNHALRSTTNLRHLNLMLYSSNIVDRTYSPLLGCIFQLRTCVLIGADYRERIGLEVQKELVTLTIIDSSPLPSRLLTISSESLPKLSVLSFTGPTQGLYKIRPAIRNVTRMHLSQGLSSKKKFEQVKSLFLDTDRPAGYYLRSFPSLTHLRMNIFLENATSMAQQLIRTPFLQKLHLHGTIYPTHDLQNLVQKVFATLPFLCVLSLKVNEMDCCRSWVSSSSYTGGGVGMGERCDDSEWRHPCWG